MTKDEQKKGTIQLEGEDRIRAIRLHEEITSRLVELSLITARTLGKEAPSLSRLTFEQILGHTVASSGKPPQSISAFLKVTQLDGNGNCVGVYEDPPGICRSCGPGD